MKKFILFLITVLMVVVLCGCVSNQPESTIGASNQTDSTVVDGQPSMFVRVENGPSWSIYYHKDTKVIYAVSRSSYNCGTFTLLVNADGSPMLWEGE